MPPVVVASPGSVAPAAAAAGDSRGFTIVAALLVALGGVIVPVLGWIVGISMVWMSRTWTIAEKWVATLTGPLSLVVAAGIAAIVSLDESKVDPVTGEAINPVMPALIDVWLSSALLFIAANVVVGIWLLWRAQRRR